MASSSAGNAYYLALKREGREDVKLLIELGINYKDLVTKLMQNQITLNDIDAVLVTHGHMDHSKSIREVKERGKDIYSNSLLASSTDKILSHGVSKYIAANTQVTAITVEHDAEDPLAFIIKTDKETVLFATDLKLLKADVGKIQFDYVFIEANYDDDFIHHAIKNAELDNDYGNLSRYKRLLNSHMSISNCIKHLRKMDLSQCKGIFLMHLSDRHANEIKFRDKVKRATGVSCYVCKKNGGFI